MMAAGHLSELRPSLKRVGCCLRLFTWLTTGVALGLIPLVLPAQDFNVTASGNQNYVINGTNDPALTLQRGVTYVFAIGNLATHPFRIQSTPGTNGVVYNNGVSNNGATSGNVTFNVPANAPNSLFYQCGSHIAMVGTLTIVTPPSPPTVQIVHIDVSQFVTIASTGTNGWSAVPEYKCGPDDPNWEPVSPYTNSFSNGTNTTTFPLFDPICGSTNVLIRIRNQQS